MKTSTKLVLAALIIMFTVSFSFVFYDFIEPRITGNALVSTRLVITSTSESNCNITFEEGWNLISFPCMTQIYGLEDFFDYSELNTTNRFFSVIKVFNNTDANDPWKAYNPDLPNWTVQDTINISKTQGYWFYVVNASVFLRNDTIESPSYVDLYEGWNLIGYPSAIIKTMNETYGNLIPEFDFVETFNATDSIDSWKQWTWNSSLTSNQDLNYSNRFLGYWIFMHSNGTLVVT
jgi:hypothetical protein